jgi:hypothetical protein
VKHFFLHKNFSIGLSLLVLFSTLSITVEKHFCGDNLIDVALFSEAKSCGMKMASETKIKKLCCKNEVELIKGQDELKITSSDDLDFEKQQFLTNYVYSYTILFESRPKQIVTHKDYSPPNLVADIQVLGQVFLI